MSEEEEGRTLNNDFIVIIKKLELINAKESRDISVGIAMGYGLDCRASIPCRSKFFSSPQRPDRLWRPHTFLSNSIGGSFPGGKAAGA
jgi:hypothetical protein